MLGKIVWRSRARQLNDFSGLVFDYGISPTDIDGLIEYRDSCYIFIELKSKGKSMSRGQAMAFQRLTDDLQITKPTIFILAEHETEDEEQDVDAANCIVSWHRYNHTWFPGSKETVRQLCDRFIKQFGDYHK